MHYIIGTAFRIPTQQEQQVRPQGIVSSVGQGSTVANVAREWVDFEPGHTYTLYNIQKVDEGVQYVFSSQTGAQQVVKVFESGSNEENFYVEDGIIEFKNNCLSILTSKIFNIKKIDKSVLRKTLSEAEKETENKDISDQAKYLLDQKIDVLKSLNLN